MMSSKLASGLGGKHEQMLGQEGGETGKAELRERLINENFRDKLEVRTSKFSPSWTFLDFEKTVWGGHSEVQTEQKL